MSEAVSRYRPDVDGLRALAVGAVLIFHAFPEWLPGGFVGVDVFFVISGYLISGIVLSAACDGRFSLAHFYARRIRRIFPALTVVLIAVLAAGWFALYADDYARLGEHVAAGAAFLSNIELWNESSYFDVSADLKPLLHLWSLGIEEQFYLAWPVILAVSARWRRGPLAVTLAIGAASFVASIVTVRTDPTAAFYAPWTRFWELLAGAVLACSAAGAGGRSSLDRLQSSPRMRNTAAAVALAMIVAAVMLIDAKRAFPGFWVLLPVAGTALMLAAGSHAWANRAILSRRGMVWLGMISYPLYLWHWPLLSFAKIIGGGRPTALIRAGLLAASIVLAWLTYRVVERPARFTLRSPVILPPLATAMVLIFAAGLTVSAKQGFIERAINRNDAARLVDYYERMHYHSLGKAYRFECDFNDRDTKRVRQSLPPSCLERGREHTVMLWGDSFAQALSLGLRENLPDGTSLAQIATSSCRAQIEDFDTSVEDNRCEIADRYAMQQIAQLRPDIVVLAQNAEHLETDWSTLTGKVLALGATQVVVVGPSPMWDPTLPRVYASHHMQDRAQYVSDALNLDGFDVDRQLAQRIAALPHVRYVSLLGHLCRDGACLAVVPDDGPL
ncbi:MAG: acyltransferase family protein, partial [Acidobacteriota bacterium]